MWFGFKFSELVEIFGTIRFMVVTMAHPLPFGANDRFDNLITMLLTVGSPTLAAYLLALTVLNGRWVAKLFTLCNYCYDMAFQQVIIISFNLILSGRSHLILEE